MDLITISQELNKRFLAPLPEFYKRRIIVWYDEEREFEDQINDLELQNAKLVCLCIVINPFVLNKSICLPSFYLVYHFLKISGFLFYF